MSHFTRVQPFRVRRDSLALFLHTGELTPAPTHQSHGRNAGCGRTQLPHSVLSLASATPPFLWFPQQRSRILALFCSYLPTAELQ